MSASTLTDPSALPHDSRQPSIWAASIITWVISLVFVTARFYTRWFIIRILGPTDWFLLLALLLTGVLCATEIVQAQWGLGAHVWDLSPTTPAQQIETTKVNYVNLVIYGFALFSIKISILLLYDAIFRVTRMRTAVYTVAAIVLVSNVWQFYVIFTACTPLAAFWDPSVIPTGGCRTQPYWLSNNYLHIATDFLIFLIPIPAVWGLNAGRKQKALILGLFALGFFVCIISILRITLLTPLLADPGADSTYALATVALWTVVEVNLAVWCAALMTLKPFVSHFFPGLLSSLSQSADSNGGAGSGGRVGGSNGKPPTIGSGPARKLGSGGHDGWPGPDDELHLHKEDDIEMGSRHSNKTLREFDSQTSLAQHSIGGYGNGRA